MLDASRELGYNEEQCEWIFRSKHSRWFYDEVDDGVLDFVKNLFVEYLKNNKNKVKEDLEKVAKGEQP
jgi:hypothetical protein